MSITSKDRVEQFKRELRSYRYYKMRIEELELKLEELNNKMVGVSSTPPKEVIAGSMSAKVYHNNMLELIERKELIENEINFCKDRIKKMDKSLSAMSNNDAEVLKELYVKRVPYDIVADEQGYSVDHMKRRVNTIIKNNLKDDTQCGL